MDRSYPYSRRVVSRARLRTRVAAVAAAGLAGAAALFMVAWKPETLPAATASAGTPLLALADSVLDGQARGPRRIYPYSVVPGGVAGQAELARVIRTDRVVAAHYASFDIDKARPVVVDKPRAVHVSYRKGDKVYWTARKVVLAEGETLLSDGRNEMRARCANRISDVSQYPIEAHQPAMDELDHAVEVEEGEEYALGPDGLPVSIDPATGMPRQAGQRFVVRGGGGIGAAPAGGPADTMLAGSSHAGHAPGAATPSLIATMGLSGSSSSTRSLPRPGSGTQASSTASTASGASGAGAPAPSDATSAPALVPDTGNPAGSPLPDSAPALPSAQTPPSTVPASDPAPLPKPTPRPTPLPGTAPSFTVTPAPVPQPGGQQAGSGGATGGLPVTPGNGPLLPQPGPGSEPFIPNLALRPGLEIGAGQPDQPADVPEPGSIWLAGAGLAALYALRRRRPRQADGR